MGIEYVNYCDYQAEPGFESWFQLDMDSVFSLYCMFSLEIVMTLIRWGPFSTFQMKSVPALHLALRQH